MVASGRFDSYHFHMPSIAHLTDKDVKRYGLLGDPDFDEARNKRIIKKTIEDHDKVMKAKIKRIDEGIAERSDMLASYIRHVTNKSSDKSFEEYVGWNNIKHLWGEARVAELKERAVIRGYL